MQNKSKAGGSPSGKPNSKHARGDVGKGETAQASSELVMAVEQTEDISPIWWRIERESMMDEMEKRFEKMMLRAVKAGNEKAEEAKEIAEEASKHAQEAKVAASEAKEAISSMRTEMRSEIKLIKDQLTRSETSRHRSSSWSPACDDGESSYDACVGGFKSFSHATDVKKFVEQHVPEIDKSQIITKDRRVNRCYI